MKEKILVALGVSFRVIMWLFSEFLFGFVFYVVGYPIGKLATLGKHPQQKIFEERNHSMEIEMAVSFAGFIASSVLFYVMFR